MAKKIQEISLDSLSEGAKGAVVSKKLAGQDSFKHWQKLFGELTSFDAQTDTLYQKAASRRTLHVVLAVVCFLLLMVLPPMASNISGAAALVVAGLQVVLGIVFIVLAVARQKEAKGLKAVDISNDFRTCLAPFLEELGEDAEGKSKLKLNLDLSGLTAEKVVANREIPPGRFRKVTETVYNDPWCHLALKLVDGNVVTLDLRNYVIRQHREWRNPRGKSKSKTKWRKVAIASASLIPDVKDTEWDDGKLTERSQVEKLKVREKKGARVARLVRKWKFKTVNAEPDMGIAPNELMGMFMQLYSMLSPPEKGVDHV